MESVNHKAEVSRLFSQVHKALRTSMRKRFENMGITMPQGLVIGQLVRNGEMKITDLGRDLNLTNSTVSGIVDRLEKQQLVERRRSEEDRRIVYVRLTPNFKEIFRGVYKKAEDNFADLLSPATPEELEKIMEGLSVLERILNQRK